jgi:hypothetical protein
MINKSQYLCWGFIIPSFFLSLTSLFRALSPLKLEMEEIYGSIYLLFSAFFSEQQF